MSSGDQPEAGMQPLTPERRRELTRTHLLDAAAQVFARQGFHGASIDAIAAAAGFTKGAVYSNFKNKEDLFVALLEERVERQVEQVREAMARATTAMQGYANNGAAHDVDVVGRSRVDVALTRVRALRRA